MDNDYRFNMNQRGDCPPGVFIFLAEIIKRFPVEIRNALRNHSKPGEPMLSQEHLFDELIVKLMKQYGKLTLETLEQKPGYLEIIVRNTANDFYRKRSSNWFTRVVPIDVCINLSSEEPDEESENSYSEAQVRRAISALQSPEQKECILLYYRDAVRQKEISERLKISVDAVNSRINRGRINVRKHLLPPDN